MQLIWRHGYFRLSGQPFKVDANSEHAPIMTRPLFSILLPSRNRLELLHHAVHSVLRQDADLEIVIADNASDEFSIAITYRLWAPSPRGRCGANAP